MIRLIFMSRLIGVCFSALSVGVLSGCCTLVPANPVAQFKQMHPKEAGRFSVLYPTSLDTYSILLGERMAKINGIVTGMKQRFGAYPGVAAYAEKTLSELGAETRHAIEHLEELEKKSSGGGVVCQYQWRDGETKETGLLVIKHGEIIYKEPWVTDYPDK
jgi:hypothetical protein